MGVSECTCFVTDEKYWFRYGSAVEPGSAMEQNPECPVHIPAGVVQPAVTAWDLLGIAPDFTGGLSVDDWMDQERGRL
jgi:hypothetical protein